MMFLNKSSVVGVAIGGKSMKIARRFEGYFGLFLH